MAKTFDEGRDEVARLVRYFQTNRSEFLDPGTKEAHVRQTLIDPLFEALGWDVRNAAQVAPQYREVVTEDRVETATHRGAPDYAFRVGTLTRFFVEAKKCVEDVRGDARHALQTRSYGWNAKLPLAVLTNFADLALYECFARPDRRHPARKHRVMHFACEEYVDRWRELWDVLSREAVWSGAFDQFAASKKRRGTAEVDVEFLRDLERWRESLAVGIARLNPDLSAEDLGTAVQRTIDRVVFLRMAEDRGLEPERRLLALSGRQDVYAHFMQDACRRADEKYDSGLFHFHREQGESDPPDRITPRLNVDDKVFRPILQGLYSEHDCPYDFSLLPVEILGTVYERFLGKTIRLTPGRRVRVEEKPEVRKAGGVYYTPSFVVEAVVRETVGRRIAGRSPQQLAGGTKGTTPFRVLDPACGSGSFLLGAYSALLDHCLAWYVARDPRRHRQAVYNGTRSGHWRLTIEEKKRILVTHVFGVDVDPQAVETSKLSLLLKVLEGEDDVSVVRQRELFESRALPNLAGNVRCGNSLISPRDLAGELLPDADVLRRINALDWETAFPEALADGGFDCVVGNPPYVRLQTLRETAPHETELYRRLYASARRGNYDLYVVFLERGLQLLKENGRLGFICPNKFFNAQYGAPVRKLLSEGRHLSKIVHFGDQQVFEGATTYTCLLFLEKSPVERFEFAKVDDLPSWRAGGKVREGTLPAGAATEAPWNFAIGKAAPLLRKVRRIRPVLKDVADLFVGLQTSADGIYVVPLDAEVERGLTKPFLQAEGLVPYGVPCPSARLIFPYDIRDGKAILIPPARMKASFPRGWRHLVRHRAELEGRDRGTGIRAGWYAFGRSQNIANMDAPKLVVQVTANRSTVLLDEEGLHMTGGGSGPFYGIRPTDERISLRYLLGLLNSRLFGWFVRSQSTPLRGGYVKFSKQYIADFPVVVPDELQGGRVVRLVDSLLVLHRHLAAADSETRRTVLHRQIEAAESELDRIVCGLYGLTDPEAALVREASRDPDAVA